MDASTTVKNNDQAPLRELHGLLAQAMIDKLKSGEEIKASGWDVIREFLLDNGTKAEIPNEYEAYPQGITGNGNDTPIYDPLAAYNEPIPHPMTAYDHM